MKEEQGELNKPDKESWENYWKDLVQEKIGKILHGPNKE